MSKSSSSFSLSVLKLASGSTIAQSLIILTTPILTRLFAPEAFGFLALFTSISAVIGTLACLRYELSIVLPSKDEKAANLLGVSVCSAVLVSAITAILIVAFGTNVAKALNSPSLEKYLWLIPTAVLSNGLFLAFSFWKSRVKQFGRLSIARVLRSVVQQGSKLGAGLAGFTTGGILIISNIVGQLLTVGYLGQDMWKNDRKLFLKSIRWGKLVAGLRRYKKFPLYDTWSAALNAASRNLPPLFLAFFFTPKIVGFFAIGIKLLALPMAFVGEAIAQVFFQKASATKHKGDLGQVVEEIFQRLVSLGMFPFLLLSLLGKDLFSFVFGSQWAEAGVYIQILSIWIFFVFISSPLSYLFDILEVQNKALIFNIFLFISRLISLAVGGMTGSARITVALFSFVGIIFSLVMIFWILFKVNITPRKGISILVKNFFFAVPFLFIIHLFHNILRMNFLLILGSSIICSVTYYSIIIFKDIRIRTELNLIFKNISK